MAAVKTLKEFCLAIGQDDEDFLAEIDEKEYVSVTFAGQEVILSVFEKDSVCVKTELGFVDLNGPNLNYILMLILEGNFEFSGTKGGTLGVNSNTGEVCLFFRFFPQDISQSALQNLVAEFVDVAKVWSDLLRTFNQGAL